VSHLKLENAIGLLFAYDSGERQTNTPKFSLQLPRIGAIHKMDHMLRRDYVPVIAPYASEQTMVNHGLL
jgi:hypothetical protein